MRPVPYRSDAGAPPYAGGRVLDTEFGRITTPNITPDRADRDRRLERGRFRARDALGHRARRLALPAGLSVSVLQPADRPRPRRHQGVSRHLPAVSRPELPGAARWRCGSAPAPRWRLRRPRCPALGATIRPGMPHGIAAPISSPRSAAAANAIRRATGSARPIRIACSPASPARPRRQARRRTSPRTRKPGSATGASDDIVTVLTDGTTPDFDEVGGSMAEIVKNTARLTEEDRRAIAAYLQSVPPMSGPERK